MQYGYKDIWKIAYPILISLLMEHMIGLTDTAFLGRVGEVELGASALAGVYFAALFMLGLGFSIGAQIMMARRNGERDYRNIGALFQQGVFFLVIIAGLMFTFSKTLSPLLLGKIIESENVYQAAISYLDWRIYGMFFAFISLLFRAFFVSITRTKIMTLNAIVMVLSNVVLNYALIFGKFGFPQMGIAGAAIASTFAEFVSMVFYIVYTYVKVDWRKYGLFDFHKPNLKLLGSMLGISSWMMLQSFLAVGTWFIFFLAIEHLGERPLAITNLVRSISSMVFMTVNAYASATSSLVGNLMGAEKTDQVLPVCFRSIKLAYMTVLPLLLIFAIIPQWVLRIYTDNWDLIFDAVPSLLVMSGAYLISTSGFVFFNAVSGTGNTRSVLLIESLALVFYMIFVWYVVIHLKANVAVCWTSEILYGGLLFLFSYWYLKKANWQTRVI